MPTISSSSLARAARFPLEIPAYIIGNSTFFWALVREMRLKFWKTKPIFRLRIADSSSSLASFTFVPSRE